MKDFDSNQILGLQPRDKAAMLVVLVVNTVEFFLEQFTENRV